MCCPVAFDAVVVASLLLLPSILDEVAVVLDGIAIAFACVPELNLRLPCYRYAV